MLLGSVELSLPSSSTQPIPNRHSRHPTPTHTLTTLTFTLISVANYNALLLLDCVQRRTTIDTDFGYYMFTEKGNTLQEQINNSDNARTIGYGDDIECDSLPSPAAYYSNPWQHGGN